MTITEIAQKEINIEWRPKIVYVSRNGVEIGVKRDIGDQEALSRAINLLFGDSNAIGN